MRTFVTAAGMAMGASAALLPRDDGCCFQLSASGGASGTLGQLDDGQNRIGGGLGEATYCINNGMITDKSGRGCILTGPTTQFQCDMGASPDGGFSVGSGGNLEHDGDSTFWECPADSGEYNIYTEKVDDQPKCEKVTLSTGGQCAGGESSSSAPSSSPAKPTTTSQGQTCPPQQTVTKTETKVNENTDYKTKTAENTQYKPTTIYKTETQQNTKYQPTTLYKTETQTQQNTQVVPTTVYSTKTIEETETATKTVYETKTQQQTVTNATPTTVYQTKTLEETETDKKPVTQYVTQTQQQTVTNETPTTVTKTIEETETAKKPVTQYVTKHETKQGPAQTVTKSEQYCPSSQGGDNEPSKTMATQTKPTPTSEGSACPTDLDGDYEYPHLIVPVSSEHPDQSYGTSYDGHINRTTSSLFNFDVPKSYEGQTCSLVFLFPKKSQLETSDFTFNGKGSISVDHLGSAAKQSTTWNSVPEVADHAGDFSPQPGNSYVISTGECAAGTTQSYELSAGGDLALDYFQDYNPSPIGLYITTC